jgi:hypothetical protein
MLLLRVGAFAFAVVMERRRIASGSPGKDRRADARTGAAPSLRQTTAVLGAQAAIRWLLNRAIPISSAAQRRRRRDLEREIERVRSQHRDDPSARREAIVDICRQRSTGPASIWLPTLARGVAVLAVNRCPVPFLTERRTVADLLAGTRLVRDDRPSRWARLRRGREGP